MVSYEEFVPIAFSVLVERMTDGAAMVNALSSPDALARLVFKAFEAAAAGAARGDKVKNSGGNSTEDERVPAATLETLIQLREKGVGLTRMQIATVMGEADADTNRRVAWRVSHPSPRTCSGVSSAETAESRRGRGGAAFFSTESAEALASLPGVDRSLAHAVIGAAFKAADADGSGTLDRGEVTVLRSFVGSSAGGSGGLTIPPKARRRCWRAGRRRRRRVQYAEMVDFFCDVLLHVERSAAVDATLPPRNVAPRRQKPPRWRRTDARSAERLGERQRRRRR